MGFLEWGGEVREAGPGKDDDRGFGHHEGTYRVERPDPHGKVKTCTLPNSRQSSVLLPRAGRAPLCMRNLPEEKQP